MTVGASFLEIFSTRKDQKSPDGCLQTHSTPTHCEVYRCLLNRNTMSRGEWQDVFSTIDESGTGSIPASKMGLAVRAAGGYPTQDQVKTMISKADPSGSGKIGLEAFLTQMEWINKVNPLDINEIAASFKVFDKDDNGTISRVELAHILCSMGDKLTMDEADEFVKEAYADKDGSINYMQFLKQLTET